MKFTYGVKCMSQSAGHRCGVLSKKLIFFLISLAVISIFVVLVFYPQLFQCKNAYKLDRYRVYFCGTNKVSLDEQRNLNVLLRKTDQLIMRSDIFDPNVKIKLFLKTGEKPSFNLPLQFNKEAYAQTIPGFNNIFAWDANLETDEIFIPSGHSRPLSAVLAHEAIHVLYDKHYGLRKKLLMWVDKSEHSTYGFMWKEEGYAEYIAGGSGINMEDGLRILNEGPGVSYHPYEVDYFRYFLCVKYLVEVKNLTLDQIIYTKMDFNTVLHDATKYFSDEQKA